MSSDYYGGIAGEMADAGDEDDGDDRYEEYKDGVAMGYINEDGTPRDDPEPPEEYLEAEAERHFQIHRDKEHGGGECDCPVAEPEYSEEAPF